jgi:hypothetical protein
MHPYEPAPSREIKRGIAFKQSPPPVLVELECPRDARSEVRQIDSRRLCGHFPPNSAALSRADEGSVSDDFRKIPAASRPVGNAPHSHFFHRKNK